MAPFKCSNVETAAQTGKEADKKEANLEEEDEDEEWGNQVGERQFVWDATKGCLVDAEAITKEGKDRQGKDKAKVPAAPKAEIEKESVAAADVNVAESAPAAPVDRADDQNEGKGDEDDAEESSTGEESESEAGEVDADTASKMAFLNEASTPELIKQALAVGGQLAESVTNKWVFDKGTELYFRYDNGTQQMHCWNPHQNYMYLWKGRGRLEFLWTPTSGTPAPAAADPQAMPPPPASADADVTPSAASTAPALKNSTPQALWVTVIPPSVLNPVSLQDPYAICTEEVEVPSRAVGQIIGKSGSSLKEIETHSGVKASIRPRGDDEQAAHVLLEGTRDQIAAAKLVVEQKLIMAVGVKKVEQLQKHQNSELLEKKRTETGAEAAIGGVDGLKEFAEKHSLKAVLVRKLRKLDAMMQKYFINHFKPYKAKPENALRSYVTTLMMHPQRWRLHALYEAGELDGDICETAIVQSGRTALIGLQRSAVQEILGEEEALACASDEQMIELEIDNALGAQANRVFGDVQPEHCRLLTLGGDFYAMALESKIGTVIDGKKYRQEDGPVPLRDGSTLAVGKYILYCEINRPEDLQERRRRITAGDNFWKIINIGASSSQDGKKECVAESGGGESKEQNDANGSTASVAEENVPTDMDTAMEALSALIGDDDDKDEEAVDDDSDVKHRNGGDSSGSTAPVVEETVPTDMDAAMEALSALIEDGDEKYEKAADDNSDEKHRSGGDNGDLEMVDVEPVTAELFSIERSSKRKREDFEAVEGNAEKFSTETNEVKTIAAES